MKVGDRVKVKGCSLPKHKNGCQIKDVVGQEFEVVNISDYGFIRLSNGLFVDIDLVDFDLEVIP